ncbi:hypothetical protein [Gloeobacter kilaueensis]|uniref:Acetyltransferase n=1 Tax=Gloeobacter kilaueensis (strain ATCC BAA-2537 / CCAP 1431/1 / ULC 316 / JS1) TaxID=1183438 RepID=U5QL73_GLOK1|nr:hypothetical protein [Gloeobacter kilaueensis]AGY58329.1 hypothetical protein GKIL_2083 [Gloeobacter kilaueensis JS1]
MLLKHRGTDDLIEVLAIDELIAPSASHIQGQLQAGQEEQEARAYAKAELVFPSDEPLPRCWVDAHYRNGS